MKERDNFVLVSFILLICGVVFGFQNKWEFKSPKQVCVTYKIKAVGGCNGWGKCGVELESGHFVISGYPVVGEPVTRCHWED